MKYDVAKVSCLKMLHSPRNAYLTEDLFGAAHSIIKFQSALVLNSQGPAETQLLATLMYP